MSGYSTESFTTFGFPPSKGQARDEWLDQVSSMRGTVVFLESPHRVKSALDGLAKRCGDRPICVCRELTKIHEEAIRGSVFEAARQLDDPKGEFTIVLGPYEPPRAALDPDNIPSEFVRMTENGLGRRDAVGALAEKYGLRSRDVYQRIEDAKRPDT